MPDVDPTREEYLAVVSEWSGYGHQSASLVGNAYPLFCLTRNEVVERPLEQFPNPGYIFLVNRGELTSWDFVRIRPGLNKKYKNSSLRECYYISMAVPQVIDASADLAVATLLEVANFDPLSSSNLIRNPPQGVMPIFFVRNVQQRIYGPLQRTQLIRNRMDALEAIQWEPHGEEGIVYEFSLEDLNRLGIHFCTYEHPERELNQVVEQPFTLLVGPVLHATSAKAFDRIPDMQLAEWYLRWRDVLEVPEEILKTLRLAPDYLQDTPSSIIRQRCRRLANLFGNLDVLQTERRHAARRYLETEEGKATLEQQLAIEVTRRAQSLEDEVKKRRLELAAEQQRLSEQMADLEAGRKRLEEEWQQELKQYEEKREQQRDLIRQLEDQIRQGVDHLAGQVREQVPLLAALASGMRATLALPTGRDGLMPMLKESKALRPAPTLWSEVKPVPPTRELECMRDENALIDQLVTELADSQLYFTRDFIANLFISLKANPLNLITGPPGYGKSSVVAALARALGHGNAMLEIAVRRSWSDDRYLLGFFDSFHGRYDPGPTGLATRLLQAQYDWEMGGDGVYLVVLDEFNLAAPEYYFSQLLQILPRITPGGNGTTNGEVAGRSVRLFDPAALHDPQGSPQRHELLLYPNTFFWGTINYDETTERLSPRLLDRTGMIFLTASDVSRASFDAGLASVEDSPDQRKGLRAHQLLEWTRTADQCPDELWDRMDPLLQILRRQTDTVGSGLDLSPRVIENIKRYLANSVGLLTPVRAVDFAFQQKILPVLRGRGTKYAARITSLRDHLAQNGFERSARHVSDAIAQADLNFGDIDFFAY